MASKTSKASKSKRAKKPAPRPKKASPKVVKAAPAKAKRLTRIRQKPDVLKKYLYSKPFAIGYAIFGLLVLLSSSVYWSLLAARVQQSNADQLINVYLFEKAATFKAAHLPAAHTFLLKWPFLWLVHALHSTNNAFAAVTVGLVMLTVALFAAILYKIERRALIFGTLCLALASVLVMIPTQPYAGGLLPVNMAMLTTRNIEYIVYIVSLALIIKAPRLKNYRFWLAVVLMGLLVASDKLFMTLSVGGALIALVVYLVFRRRDLARLPLYWLLASAFSAIAGIAVIAGINALHITHIANQTGASPYALAHTVKDLILGAFYAVFSLATNLGANPAAGTTTVKAIPHHAYRSLVGIGGLTFIVNACLLFGGLFMVWRLFVGVFKKAQGKLPRLPDNPTNLSLLLVWSSLAALAAFVATKHDYVVDARYLTIAMFALFVSAATYLRSKHLEPQHVVLYGLVLTLTTVLGLTATIKINRDDLTALTALNNRNSQIAQVLKQHPVDALVGDYWRVAPTRQTAEDKLAIVPLSDCLKNRDTLTSNTWDINLRNHSFAYLLTLDPSLTDYPGCNLNQVINAYGRPNTSTLIDGTLSNPKELLLFYDSGANHSAPAVQLKTPSTVLPIPLKDVPNTLCDGHATTMNVVAHQDDDLLFMNPDLFQSIKAGNCIRTVYLTAGDDGVGSFYWLSRERGAEAAYSYMLGSDAIWVQRIVRLDDGQFITIANPKGNSKITLVFMHLPDGNLFGQGFRNSHDESLQKLERGEISEIHAVDGQSQYTADQLAGGLVALMNLYKPNEVRTQTPVNYSHRYPDHSDHLSVGKFMQRAFPHYNNAPITPISYYIGYPIRDLAVNEQGQALDEEQAAFFAYARFDPSVCQTVQECDHMGTYGAYLRRQYKAPDPK